MFDTNYVPARSPRAFACTKCSANRSFRGFLAVIRKSLDDMPVFGPGYP